MTAERSSNQEAMNWQCPICFQYLLDAADESSAVVPCIIASCNSANHPICLDCCWDMKKAAKDQGHVFKCPLCKTPATLLLPIHCMVSSKNVEAQKKIDQAEEDLRPQKAVDNSRGVDNRKKEEFVRKIIHSVVSLTMLFGTFCLCAVLVYFAFQTLIALLKQVVEFCFNPWCVFIVVMLYTMPRGTSEETKRKTENGAAVAATTEQEK